MTKVAMKDAAMPRQRRVRTVTAREGKLASHVYEKILDDIDKNGNKKLNFMEFRQLLKPVNRRAVYLESPYFFHEFSAGFRWGFGGVAAWEAGFRRGCGVGYLENEKILRKFDVN